eukprot:COSAG01_NODE_1332_length_10695_cov_19.161854_2_plen_276_part_00
MDGQARQEATSNEPPPKRAHTVATGGAAVLVAGTTAPWVCRRQLIGRAADEILHPPPDVIEQLRPTDDELRQFEDADINDEIGAGLAFDSALLAGYPRGDGATPALGLHPSKISRWAHEMYIGIIRAVPGWAMVAARARCYGTGIMTSRTGKMGYGIVRSCDVRQRVFNSSWQEELEFRDEFWDCETDKPKGCSCPRRCKCLSLRKIPRVKREFNEGTHTELKLLEDDGRLIKGYRAQDNHTLRSKRATDLRYQRHAPKILVDATGRRIYDRFSD